MLIEEKNRKHNAKYKTTHKLKTKTIKIKTKRKSNKHNSSSNIMNKFTEIKQAYSIPIQQKTHMYTARVS